MVIVHLAPLCRLVTRSAVRTKLSLMIVLRRMAGETILRRVLERSIYMTRLTINIRMRTSQREGGDAVIVEHFLPLGRLVA